jgi:hypothetical protein
MKLSPYDCASLIVSSVKRKAEEKEKKITRFQLSLISLSKICNKKVITSLYLENLSDELHELGWCMFQVENTKFAFIQAASVSNWMKFSSKSLNKVEEK